MSAPKELTSQQIKLAILRWLNDKYNGEYKYNIIGRVDAPVGAIENLVDGRFSSEQRHLASRCFDELRAADLIRSTYSGNQDPENWVEITKAGRAALESGVIESADTLEAHKKEPATEREEDASPKHGVDVAAKYIFLDIVGFTHNRSTEAQADIVKQLNEIVIESIKNKSIPIDKRIFIPTGDGICIALLGIEHPVDIHIQIALSILGLLHKYNTSIQHETRRFQVRIGIDANTDTLVVDINNQQNIAGAGISMASRIMNLADGNQILVGQAVYDILRHREKYTSAFNAFQATVKHGTQISVYQFISSDYNGLNITPPTRCQSNQEDQTRKGAASIHLNEASQAVTQPMPASEVGDQTVNKTESPAISLSSNDVYHQSNTPLVEDTPPVPVRKGWTWWLGPVILAPILLIAFVGLALWAVKWGAKPYSAGGRPTPTQTPIPTPPQSVFSLNLDALGELSARNELYEFTFSPDGQVVAAVGAESEVHLWRVADGSALPSLKGASRPSRSIAISPDGAMVASGNDSGTIYLWPIGGGNDGKALGPLRGHTRYVFIVSFSADGQTLTSASEDKTIRRWRVSDGKELEIIKLPRGQLVVALGPDQQTVALYVPDIREKQRIHLWSLNERRTLAMMVQSVEVSCGAFSPEGGILAIGSVDGTVRLWRVSDGGLLNTLEVMKGTPGSITFSPDGQVVATGWRDGVIRLWRVSDGSLLKEWKGHQDAVDNLTFSKDGKMFASGAGRKIGLWRIGGS